LSKRACDKYVPYNSIKPDRDDRQTKEKKEK